MNSIGPVTSIGQQVAEGGRISGREGLIWFYIYARSPFDDSEGSRLIMNDFLVTLKGGGNGGQVDRAADGFSDIAGYGQARRKRLRSPRRQ